MIILEDQGIKATFNPDKGLNLMSLVIEGHELIEQSTLKGFLESSRGLGPLIGPHFHHRVIDTIPYLDDAILDKLQTKLQFRREAEPFSHGIARYVPWKVTRQQKNSFHAILDSHDTIEGITLGEIEGFDFVMEFEATVSPRELQIVYKAKSTTQPVVVGLHTYYNLQPTMNTIDLVGAPFYYDKLNKKTVPPEWYGDRGLKIPLNKPLDYTFSPQLDKEGFGEVKVKTGVSNLLIQAKAYPDLSFQLYRMEDSPFICIEPIAAINPRIVTQKNASIEVRISL
jgi:galactose mutarotase-like enzyme